MAATLWDSFEDFLQTAENHFLNSRFEQAIQAWDQYYKITAKTEYKKIIEEVQSNWDPEFIKQVDSLDRLYTYFTELQLRRTQNKISQFTYELFKKLVIKIYKEQFRDRSASDGGLEAGVFEYLSGNISEAQKKLTQILTLRIEDVQPRIYLGFTYLDSHDQKTAVALLTENMFLAADKLPEEALYLSQFKLLYGKIFSDSGNREEAAWLLAFESWYRNYLIFTENKPFFRLMQQKESNERIMQVKYYSYERYRHFVRCLYLSEYIRHFQKEQTGTLHELENYMQKLDRELFARYRKKRKDN